MEAKGLDNYSFIWGASKLKGFDLRTLFFRSMFEIASNVNKYGIVVNLRALGLGLFFLQQQKLN